MSNLKELVLEWLRTFSNQPSAVSSKRLERFAVFTSMLLLSIYFVINSILKCSISAAELMIVVGTWLGYAGFNTIQIKKDNESNENK
ncbi:MAG: hypothetical protein ACEQSR_16385 [Candidatus Methylacidiphilales bacterium]